MVKVLAIGRYANGKIIIERYLKGEKENGYWNYCRNYNRNLGNR